jgi:protoporphyrin/coproporphyrin ferrochelatase
MSYDSVLIVSFGGPEGPDDVIPFLENVLRGKNVPRERMLEVAEHYQHFGGVSPINAQCRALIDALRHELDRAGIDLPIYWGNRNWAPLLPNTLKEMQSQGKHKTIAFFTNMFSCYSGCRQYRENVAAAQQSVGPDAPIIEKVRFGFNHPLFIKAQTEIVGQAFARLRQDAIRENVKLLFSAHSIPLSMADNCNYVKQLNEAARLVAEGVQHSNWELVYQSRSGPPQQPWLEPDICDRIEQAAASGTKDVIVVPLGFVSDHMEVLFDLDTEAKDTCQRLGLGFVRADSVGVHPDFIRMIRELIQERLENWPTRAAVGQLPASHDVCPENCCLYTQRRPMA